MLCGRTKAKHQAGFVLADMGSRPDNKLLIFLCNQYKTVFKIVGTKYITASKGCNFFVMSICDKL